MATLVSNRLAQNICRKTCKNWNVLLISNQTTRNKSNVATYLVKTKKQLPCLTNVRWSSNSRSIHGTSSQAYNKLRLKIVENEYLDDVDSSEDTDLEQVSDNPLLQDVQVGFLGGGKMAKALCEGLLNLGDIVASVSDIDKQVHRPVKELGISVTDDNKSVVQNSNVLILAVKPHIVPRVLSEVSSLVSPDHLVISVAAGVTIESLEQMLPSGTRVIRTMPNTPSLVQAGATVFAPGKHASKQDCDLVKTLFSSVGICEEALESHLDAVTGLSGSGPAYCFVAMEALSDGGVKMGLPRELANKLAAQTMMGAAKMLLETGSHPGQLKDGVTSPGGTTITAIHTLERAGFRAALIDAVEAATLRSRELGKK